MTASVDEPGYTTWYWNERVTFMLAGRGVTIVRFGFMNYPCACQETIVGALAKRLAAA